MLCLILRFSDRWMRYHDRNNSSKYTTDDKHFSPTPKEINNASQSNGLYILFVDKVYVWCGIGLIRHKNVIGPQRYLNDPLRLLIS